MRYLKHDVDAYSYTAEQNWYRNACKQTPPGWLKVTRIGVFLKRDDGTNALFYKFVETNRGYDYRAAKKIEDITWSRPKPNKAFYLMRLSYDFDKLHRDGLMHFKSDLWNRGAGLDTFKQLL